MSKAYLEITMKVPAKDRVKAGAVYSKYKPPFSRDDSRRGIQGAPPT